LLTSLALGYSNRPDRKSPGSVVATGFLPGILSFLDALSLTWRESLTSPSTCSSNFNHLYHLERVLYKLANKPHKIKQLWILRDA
jgi:hypothetical protein